MAALGTIRKRGAFLVIIIGLGLFAFIAEEMFRSCEATSNEKRQLVGEVLGKKITVQEFQTLMDEYQEVRKLTEGRDNLSEDEMNNIKDMVWNDFVTRTILDSETAALGITVTDEELQAVLTEGNHPLLAGSPFTNKQTGRFDVTQLTRFLAEYRNADTQDPRLAESYRRIYTYWQFTEKNLRLQILMEKYHSLLTHCLLSNPISAKAAYTDKSVERSLQLASLAYSTLADDKIEISDADLKDWYNAHKDMFRQPVETRDIRYVDFQVTASAADRNALLADMQKVSRSLADGADAAEIVRRAQSSVSFTGIPVTAGSFPRDIAARIDSMTVGETSTPFETQYDNTLNVVKLITKTQLPDSVEYREIQVGGATVEAARATADSIATALREGADFETLARRYGQEGKTQWLTSSQYEQAANINADSRAYLEALTVSADDGVQNIALSQGNVILQVTARRAYVSKYVAAVVKRTVDFSKGTYSDAYNRFSRFVSESTTPESLTSNAARYGYTITDQPNLSTSAHQVAYGVRGTRDAMKWVFDSPAGSVSPLYECGDNNHLLVLVLDKIHPAGHLTLDDVRDRVKAEVLRERKFEQLRDRLAGVRSIADARAKGAEISTLQGVTFAAPAYVAATRSSEPAVSGAATATAQGTLCPRVIRGNAGAYLLQVTSQKQNTGKFDARAEEKQSAQQLRRAVSPRYYLTELLLRSDIKDNRYLFF